MEPDYNAARKKFSADLAYAQTRGIGTAAYEKRAQEIDLEEAQTPGSGYSLERLSALGKKLQDQLTEIDRAGFDSIGSEIRAKIWRRLKYRISEYVGTSLEFTVGKDSTVGHIRVLQKCNSPLINRDLLNAVSQVSLNRRSPNQVELPIKVCVTPGSNVEMKNFDPVTGKLRALWRAPHNCKPSMEE